MQIVKTAKKRNPFELRFSLFQLASLFFSNVQTQG